MALPPDESAHLRAVLRLTPGDEVGIFDGGGREAVGRVAAAGKGDVVIDQVIDVPAVPEPGVAVTLGLALLKGDHMDAAIRDATALGVTTIAPVVSARVIAAGARRTSAPVDRWTRVAIAAAKQCGRSVVPVIEVPMPLVDLIGRWAMGTLIYGVEPASGADAWASGDPGEPPAAAILFVGPEGGWTEAERVLFAGRGAVGISVGPRTLRAELAVPVLMSVLWARWGWAVPASSDTAPMKGRVS